jgi:hypothetical protein
MNDRVTGVEVMRYTDDVTNHDSYVVDVDLTAQPDC